MVDLVHGLTAERVAANLELVRDRIAGAGRDPAQVEILAAVKYLPEDGLAALREGGVVLVGENRAQALLAKQKVAGAGFTWDFIGQLQSRKVRELVGLVRYIHSVASTSALDQLARHGASQTEIMIEVNVAGETGKGGIAPEQLPRFLQRATGDGISVVGLMTMAPLARAAEDNRRHFAALAELAAENGLRHLSMGTSQDYPVAAAEGATIVRLGTILYRSAP